MENENSKEEKEKLNNPSAFPKESYKTVIEGSGTFTRPKVVRDDDKGMSLRDYFAGQALAGLMSGANTYSSKNMAESAYGMADAMLKERSKYE